MTAEELATEVRQQAAGALWACVVVAFDHRTEFLFADDPQLMAKVRMRRRAGGRAIGCLRAVADRAAGAVHIDAALFPVFEAQPWAATLMRRTVDQVRRQQEAAGRTTSLELRQGA